GGRCDPRADTNMVTTRTNGTTHSAGYCSTTIVRPASSSRCPASSAASDMAPPVTMPETAPVTVSPRHQMASSTTGANDDAVKVNTMATAPASARPVVTKVATMGSTIARIAPTRKPRTVPPKNSWETTPEMDTTSPEAVDRKAANAPPATRAVSRSPVRPLNSAEGS